MTKRTVAFFIALTCLLYCLPAIERLRRTETPWIFEAPAVDIPAGEAPFFESEFISPEIDHGIAHVGSLCELKDGRFAAVWYSGSRELAEDVAVFFSVRGRGPEASWSEPRVLVSRESSRAELRRYVDKIGNPVIFSDRGERLWLIYVTVAVGGWSGSSLNVKTSLDDGVTWTRSERLTLSPFLNISELVKNKPARIEGGAFLLPIYHEFIGKFAELLWIETTADAGLAWRKTRMTSGHGLIQPSLLPLDRSNGLGFYRNCSRKGPRTGLLGIASTADSGRTWSAPRYPGAPNPDSGLDTLLLSDKSILMAYNDAKGGRENLKLAVSIDEGNTWTPVVTIEDAPGGIFSYPYFLRSRNGRIHLVYTYMNRRIKHVVMNEAWIRAQMKNG